MSDERNQGGCFRRLVMYVMFDCSPIDEPVAVKGQRVWNLIAKMQYGQP